MTTIVAVPHRLYDPAFKESYQALVQVEVIKTVDSVTYFKNVNGVITAAISDEVFTINMRQELNGHQANMKPLKEWAVHVQRKGWDQFLGTVHAVDEEAAYAAALKKYGVPDDQADQDRGITSKDAVEVSER